MNKNPKLKRERQQFVKRVVNSSKDSRKAVQRLAKRLFLSEDTIYKDLRED